MKKIIGLFSMGLLLTGCAGGMSPVKYGLVTDVRGPITATDYTIGSKTGTSCAKNILGLSASGDASIEAAKKSAAIQKVSTVDFSSKGIYPFFGTTCVIVSGE